MADTLWADVSYYQPLVDFSVYPYRWLAVRSNDGTFDDPKFHANFALAKHALDRKQLDGLIVYVVYRQNWEATLANLKAQVGTPHPRTVYMIDLESWGGQVSGDQTAGIEAMRKGIVAWLRSNLTAAQKLNLPLVARQRRRAFVYGNLGDLRSLYPGKPSSVKVVVAAYGSNPPYPGKIAHQFASNFPTPPFGPCDINSADGSTSRAFAKTVGIPLPPVTPTPFPKPTPKPVPAPAPPVNPDPADPILQAVYAVLYGTDHGPYTHAAHPNVVRGEGKGVLDRLAYLERKMSMLSSRK